MALLSGSLAAQKTDLHSGYPIDPVPFTSVKVTDSFWGQRLKASREVTIPLAFSKCEETGRYENFVKAAHPSDEYKVEGYSFDDTDVYKTIEGASYSLQTYPDKQLEKYIDSVLVIVAAAQEPDGYLYTARTMNPKHPHDWAGPERWSKVEELSHEFYNLGHMVEGAVAHYQATGKRKLLDVMIACVEHIASVIGPEEGKLRTYPGHQVCRLCLQGHRKWSRPKKTRTGTSDCRNGSGAAVSGNRRPEIPGSGQVLFGCPWIYEPEGCLQSGS